MPVGERLNCITHLVGAVLSALGLAALVTLGCARNEVDSEELAAKLGVGGWSLTDAADAEIVVINTCGFVDAAKKDSIDTVLAAADTGKKVVAVGCLAERYGHELSASLPEATVLGFDSYADISARLLAPVIRRACARPAHRHYVHQRGKGDEAFRPSPLRLYPAYFFLP